MLINPLGSTYGRLQITHIVHGIEDAKYVHPVERGPLNKPINHIISVMPVAEQILPAQQHLLRGIRHSRFECAQALPRILAQIANTRVKSRPAPGF